MPLLSRLVENSRLIIFYLLVTVLMYRLCQIHWFLPFRLSRFINENIFPLHTQRALVSFCSRGFALHQEWTHLEHDPRCLFWKWILLCQHKLWRTEHSMKMELPWDAAPRSPVSSSCRAVAHRACTRSLQSAQNLLAPLSSGFLPSAGAIKGISSVAWFCCAVSHLWWTSLQFHFFVVPMALERGSWAAGSAAGCSCGKVTSVAPAVARALLMGAQLWVLLFICSARADSCGFINFSSSYWDTDVKSTADITVEVMT